MSLATGVITWIIIVGLLVLLMDKLKGPRVPRSDDSEGGGLPYIRKGKLFTPAEASFYHVLKSAVGHQYAIFGQVRVADLLIPQKGLSKSEWQKHFNWISAKHVDFVLCDRESLQVMCAIELDDDTHTHVNRLKRDGFLDKAFQAAGLPLVRIRTKHTYAEADVIDPIRESLQAGSKTPVPARPAPVQLAASAASGKPLCPKCSSGMLKKRATSGRHAGEEFWTCSRFPACRTIIPITKASV